MPYVAGPYSNTNPYGAGPPGGQQMPGQFGQNPRNTGSWQAAGPQQPGWAAGQRPPGPNARNTGSWQAADPGQAPDWAARQAPPDPGAGFDGNPRNTGSWQAAGPQPGQGWAPGPGAGDARSWQAAGPQPGAGWVPGQGEFAQDQYPQDQYAQDQYPHGQYAQDQYPQGQFGPGTRNTGAGPAAGPAPGQPQYQGQPYSGQPYAGPGGPGLRNTGGFSHAGSPIIRQRDSALPDPSPSARGPIAAIETDNVAAFARDLRVLRSQAGLDYPDMAEKSHYTMRTLASAAGGLRLPTLPVLIAYVQACGGDVGDWEERWGRLTRAGKKGQTALLPAGGQAAGGEPAGGQAAGGQPSNGPIPQNVRQTGEIYVITSAKPRDAQW
jgi:hypothetical protein